MGIEPLHYGGGFTEEDIKNHSLKKSKSMSNKLREALENLVQIKEWKDKHGKDAHYNEAQPKAWEQAKAALSEKDDIKFIEKNRDDLEQSMWECILGGCQLDSEEREDNQGAIEACAEVAIRYASQLSDPEPLPLPPAKK